jgi:hypothetical protein
MVILFTGHRNKTLPESILAYIKDNYQGYIWMHGGAIGFDSQVEKYACDNAITQKVVIPNYKEFPTKQAPIIRNKQMVEQCDFVVACYDGRKTGGTLSTIQYAKMRGKPVKIFSPKDN